jgi:ATP-dependent Clp protease adaptor protein ClpS
MSDSPTPPAPTQNSQGQTATLTRTPPPRVDRLPPYRVLLHNDDHNEQMFVVKTLRELAALAVEQAFKVMDEADKTGVALVTITHQERAEFLVDQFKSKGLTASCERAE